eukprot:g20709.t1
MQSILMCLTIAAKRGQKASTVDIGGAYLNADMTGEEVLMELEPILTKMLTKIAPEVVPFVDDRGRLLVRLDKALYGCIQSAKLWYDNLTEFLRSIGFKHNGVDPCVMNKMIDGKQMTLVLFVDDILILSERDADTERFVKQLRDKYNEVSFCADKDLSYLGMHVRVEAGKAKIVTKDSTEAELVGLSDMMMPVMQCADFLKDQGLRHIVPTIMQDNMSTITLVTKGGGKYRNKHLKVRQAVVKERVDKGDIKIEYLPTAMMLADTLTKPLQGALFRRMTS